MACLFLSLYGLALIQEVGIIVVGVQGEASGGSCRVGSSQPLSECYL